MDNANSLSLARIVVGAAAWADPEFLPQGRDAGRDRAPVPEPDPPLRRAGTGAGGRDPLGRPRTQAALLEAASAWIQPDAAAAVHALSQGKLSRAPASPSPPRRVPPSPPASPPSPSAAGLAARALSRAGRKPASARPPGSVAELVETSRPAREWSRRALAAHRCSTTGLQLSGRGARRPRRGGARRAGARGRAAWSDAPRCRG